MGVYGLRRGLCGNSVGAVSPVEKLGVITPFVSSDRNRGEFWRRTSRQNRIEVWPSRWAALAAVGYLKIGDRPHLRRAATLSMSKENGKLRDSIKRTVKKLGV